MLFSCFYTLYFLTVYFFVYVHICIVCYHCGVTINDDDGDDYHCYWSLDCSSIYNCHIRHSISLLWHCGNIRHFDVC